MQEARHARPPRAPLARIERLTPPPCPPNFPFRTTTARLEDSLLTRRIVIRRILTRRIAGSGTLPLALGALLALSAPLSRGTAQVTERPGAIADSARVDSARVDSARADSGRAIPDSLLLAVPRIRAASRPTRVCAGGDVTIGTNLDTAWAARSSKSARRRIALFPDPDSLLRPLRPLGADADVVLLNIEGAIGDSPTKHRKCRPGSTLCYAFRQPAAAAPALRRVAEEARLVGNLANNHANDAGADGMEETVALLERAGIHVTGVDTVPTLVPLPDGDSLAVIGFSTSAGPDPRDTALVRRIVARAAERTSRIVVTMHMGAEGRTAQRTRDTTELFAGVDRGNSVAFARTAAEAGAALVVGHGPHVMRGAEWWDDALVAYSLGNLLTYGPFSLAPPNDRGALLCATLDYAGAVSDARLVSTHQRAMGHVGEDPRARAAIAADSLGRLDFPWTAARIAPDGTIRRPAPHHP